MPSSEVLPLRALAAEQAFFSLPLPTLRHLVREFGHVVPGGSDLFEVLMILVQGELEIDESAALTIVQRRASRQEVQEDNLQDLLQVEEAVEVLTPDDAKLVEKKGRCEGRFAEEDRLAEAGAGALREAHRGCRQEETQESGSVVEASADRGAAGIGEGEVPRDDTQRRHHTAGVEEVEPAWDPHLGRRLIGDLAGTLRRSPEVQLLLVSLRPSGGVLADGPLLVASVV